jgi:hypothetical protein
LLLGGVLCLAAYAFAVFPLRHDALALLRRHGSGGSGPAQRTTKGTVEATA